jgi:hypothetical protein
VNARSPRIVSTAIIILIVSLILFTKASRHKVATKYEGAASTVVGKSLEPIAGTPSEAVQVPTIRSEKRPATAAPGESAANSQQEQAFNNFLDQMNRHSELLHTEFNLLEQLSAIHQAEGENTNYLVFEKVRLAFEELGRKAATNNDALKLLLEASQFPSMSGVAVAGMGVAAESGSEKAIELLLEPEKHGWLLSSSAGALVNVARSGNEQAIDFMNRLTGDPANRGLWWFAAQALAPAAENGNDQAVSGLINMSGFENASVHEQILRALNAAAHKGNQSAVTALKQLANTQ